MLLVTCKIYNRHLYVLLVTREFYIRRHCGSLVTGVCASLMWFTDVIHISDENLVTRNLAVTNISLQLSLIWVSDVVS